MKAFLLPFLALFAVFGRAQKQPTPRDTTRMFTQATESVSEDIKVFQPKVVRESPEVMAFQAAAHTPVGHYTGRPQKNIPIYDLQSQSLSVAIGLDYQATGIKVEQEAAQVGLGWSLVAGGMIGRTVRGRDDFDGLLRFQNPDQANLNAIRQPNYAITNSGPDKNVEWQFNTYAAYANSSTDFAVQLALFCGSPPPDPLVYELAKKMLPAAFSTEMGKPRLDGESDLFSYQAGGYSGQFIIVPTASWYQIQVLQQEPVKVELLPLTAPDLTGNSGFKITTPDGTQYFFSQIERTKSRGGTSYSGKVIYAERNIFEDPINAAASIDWDLANITAAAPLITGWHLSQMVSATNEADKIEFFYLTESDQPVYGSIALPTRIQNLTVGSARWRLTDTRQDNVLLSRVSSSRATVYFDRSPRLDVRGVMAQKIDQIRVENLLGQRLQTHQFDYGYFDSGSNQPDFVRLRLKLNRLTQLSNDGSAALPPHEFSYIETINSFGIETAAALPDKNSYAQDFWGLYNGADANNTKVNVATGSSNANAALDGTMIPVQIPANATIWGFTNPANREADAQYAQLGTLSGIRFPTAGIERLDYELHLFQNYARGQISNSLLVSDNAVANGTPMSGGGLRIKCSTLLADPADQRRFLKRAYDYSSPTFGAVSSGKLMYDMSFGFIINNGATSPYQVFSSGTQYPVSYSANGSAVGYSSVKETQINSDNNSGSNGSSQYVFENRVDRRYDTFCFPANAAVPACGNAIPYFGAISACDSYIPLNNNSGGTNGILYDKIILQNAGIPNVVYAKNGLLVGKTLRSADGALVREETYTYTNLLDTDQSQPQRYRQFSSVGRTAADQYPAFFTYFVPSQWVKLDAKTSIDYFDNGSVSNTQTYTYEPVTKQMRSVSTQNSAGEQLVDYIYYAHDYLGVGSVYQTMYERNMLTQVVGKRRDNTSTQQQGLVNMAYTYRDFGTATQPMVLLETARRSFNNGSSGAPDVTLKYDSQGQIIEILPVSGVATAYLWSYANTEAVAQIVGATAEAVENALANIGTSRLEVAAQTQSSSIQYYLSQLGNHWQGQFVAADRPKMTVYLHQLGVGLLSKTDPNGLKTSYQYDGFNRLRDSRDGAGNLLGTVGYQYNPNVVSQSLLRVATTDAAAANNSQQAQISHHYIDGLGRSLQHIDQQHSPNQTDVVRNAQHYDGLGRAVKQALPAPSGANNGGFQSDPFGLANAFYGDNAAFEETTQFDNSPLNRPRQHYGAGQAWRSNQRATQVRQQAAGDQVRHYRLDGADNIVLAGYYPPNSLYQQTRRDEQGHTQVEVSDKSGQVLQRQAPDGATTCYLYDDLGRLRAVIQPRGYELNAGFVKNSAPYNNWVFGYEYSGERGLLESKQVPGGGQTESVYDRHERLVWQRTAMQAQMGKWRFMKYDAYNRLIMSGEASRTDSRANLQTEADGSQAGHHESSSGGLYTLSDSYPAVSEADLRAVSYFDDHGDWRPAELVFDGGNAYHGQNDSALGLATGNKTRHGQSQNWLTSAVYYDAKNRPIQTQSQNLYGQTERVDMEYNFAGQVLKTRQVHKNQSGGSTVQLSEYAYDHVGRKTACYQTIDNLPREKLASYSYDAVGRLVQKKLLPDGTFTIGGPPASIVRSQSPPNNTQDIATQFICLQPGFDITANGGNTYLAQIGTGGGASINGLQTIDYQYHIRGALRGINLDGNQNPNPNTDDGDLFSYKLDYETAGWFDGNIGKQTWNSPLTPNGGTANLRSYTYNYDAASRLKSAIYSGVNGEDYSIPNMNYDKNGNITNLQRRGKITPSGGWGLMDNLNYSYNGNRLSQITDAVSGSYEVDFVQRGGANYSFYDDGSLKSDANEQIQNIVYDTFLQQPTQLQLTDGRTINYYYDGGGKLLKTVYSNGEIWEFGNGMIYKNGQPYQMSMPEGRAIYQNGTWQNEFSYTDHLGNTRVSFRANGNQLEKVAETAFDPWGVVLNGLGQTNTFQNRFEMQGKESEKTFGLNRINLGARTVNQTTGVWDRVDILSDKMPFTSPFSYNFNNPLKYIDPNGAFPYSITTRAFAPVGAFKGTGFHDDGRTYSSRLDVISRISQTYTVDPSARTISGGTPTSSPTILETPVGTFSETATDDGGVNATFSKNQSGNTANISGEFEGSNPFFLGAAPDIEVASNVTLTENLEKRTLGVSINLSSKQFPATEAIIQDSNKKSIFLGGAAAYGNPANLVTVNKKSVTNVNLTINIDKNGVFQSVTFKNKTYSIDDFNKIFTPKSAGPYKREN